MHAVSANADKNRTSVPANPERRRESGWTTFYKIRLPNATVDLEKYVRSPVARTFVNLRHDYVFARKYVKRKGLLLQAISCCIPVTRLAVGIGCATCPQRPSGSTFWTSIPCRRGRVPASKILPIQP